MRFARRRATHQHCDLVLENLISAKLVPAMVVEVWPENLSHPLVMPVIAHAESDARFAVGPLAALLNAVHLDLQIVVVFEGKSVARHVVLPLT